MGIFQYLRNPFSDFGEKTESCKTTSTGWMLYSCLPYAKVWSEEQTQDWVMEKGEEVQTLDYGLQTCRATALIWVNRATGEKRLPQENRFTVPMDHSFSFAGKSYSRPQDLIAFRREQDDPGGHWRLDCYKRKIFYISERYPCFDSYDLISEDRYYRRMFFCENGVLFRVVTTDAGREPEIFVSEDVAFIEDDIWTEMEKAGYLSAR